MSFNSLAGKIFGRVLRVGDVFIDQDLILTVLDGSKGLLRSVSPYDRYARVAVQLADGSILPPTPWTEKDFDNYEHVIKGDILI